MSTANGRLTFLIENQKDFLSFLKTKYTLFHLSNVFFRDMHYGVMSYLEWKDKPLQYSQAEELTKEWIRKLESDGILKNVDRQAFTLLYPDFKKPPVKQTAPVKPAATAPKEAPSPSAAAKPASSVPAPAAPSVKESQQAG